MTSLLPGPVFPALNSRGSTHFSAPSLLVLGLGSLVLLTGLAPPAPAANDVVALTASSGAVGVSVPLLLAGGATFGLALVGMALHRRMRSLFVLLAMGI